MSESRRHHSRSRDRDHDRDRSRSRSRHRSHKNKHPVKSQYLVKETIDEYKDIGGVRIEDVVIIWKKGNENISHMLPRTVEEIEAFMADRVEGDMIPSRPTCNKGICGSLKKCSTSLTVAVIVLVAFSCSLYLYASKQ